MIKKFRKKPVVIEAVKWTGDNEKELKEFARDDILIKESIGGSADGEGYLQKYVKIIIHTKEGDMEVRTHDWIIKGESSKQGIHFWPVKPDYFQENYESLNNIPKIVR